MSMERYNYWNDGRVQAAMRSSCWEPVETHRNSIKVRFKSDITETMVDSDVKLDVDENGCGHLTVPTKRAVCYMCNGSGTVVDPFVDAGGPTSSDFDRYPDFYEEYVSGTYDVTCPTCKGERVLEEPDFPKDVQEAVDEYDAEEADFVRQCAAERAYGC